MLGKPSSPEQVNSGLINALSYLLQSFYLLPSSSCLKQHLLSQALYSFAPVAGAHQVGRHLRDFQWVFHWRKALLTARATSILCICDWSEFPWAFRPQQHYLLVCYLYYTQQSTSIHYHPKSSIAACSPSCWWTKYWSRGRGGSLTGGLMDWVVRWIVEASSDSLSRYPSPSHSFSASIFLSSSRTLITMLFDWNLLHKDRTSSWGMGAGFLGLDPFYNQSGN